MQHKTRTLACCSLLAFSWSAFGAEVPVPDDTVAERVRPELEPLGMRFGAFTIYPKIGARLYRDDNVYADSQGEIADSVAVLRPAIELKSNWTRHSLALAANAEIGRYGNNTSENFEDLRVSANSRIAISRDSGFVLSARFESLHDDRFSPDDRDGFTPAEFDRAFFAVGYERKSGKINLRLDGALTGSDYDDVAGLDGEINNDDRDRQENRFSVRVGYDIGSSTEIFVRGGVSSIDYDSAVDDDGFARSSKSHEIALGAVFDITKLARLEGFAGITERDYDDAQLENINSTWFGARLTWRVSGLTTIAADATRTLAETTLNGAGGYVATRFGASADHELLRNLILHLSVYQQENDYQGIVRHDDIVGARLSSEYIVNRNFTVVFNYDTRDRDIHDATNLRDGHDTHVISLQLTGRR